MNVKEFLARVPDSQDEVRNVIETIASAVVAFDKKAKAVRQDRRFTPEGHRERIAEMSGAPREFLRQLGANLADDQADILTRREGLVLPKTSDSVTDEMRRAEIRAYLRTQKPHEALRAMFDNDDIAEAALDAPAMLSGVTQDMWDKAHKRAIDNLHGEELTALRDEEIANNEIAAVLKIAELEISAVIDGDTHLKS
jgi:hypothetical protein